MKREAKSIEAYMPIFIAAYLRDTARLTTAQHGAYLLLLMEYWTQGGPLNDDDEELGAIVRASPQEWRKLRPKVERFFTVRDGKWHQKRAEEELAKAIELKAKRSQAGQEGADRRWQKDGNRNGKPDGKMDGSAMALPSENDGKQDGKGDGKTMPLHLKPSTLSSSSEGSGKPDYEPLDRVLALLGWSIDDPKAHHTPAHLRRWLDAGYDLDRHVLPVLSEVIAKANGKGRQIGHLRYFDSAIAERFAEKPMPPAGKAATDAPDPRAPESDAKAWARLERFDEGEWHLGPWGPTPDEPGCLIPAHILAAWRTRKAA